MPRTRSLAWSELKIGIITVIALIMAAALIFLLSGDSGFFWERYHLKTIFDNIAGLKEGAPVRVAGVEVGSVSQIDFANDRVEVTMELKDDNRSRIRTASRASLGSVSLLGEAAVDITATSQGAEIPEWGYIESVPAKGSIAEVATQATEAIDEAKALVKDLRAGRGTMGKLFTDEAVYRDLDALLVSVDRMTQQITNGRGTLGRIINDPKLHNELVAAIQEVNGITAKIRSGEGSLGKLLNDPALANSLTATTQNVEGITAKLNRGEGTVGRLMTDTALYDRLNNVVGSLEALTARLNNGDGTAGQLLQDKRLYENMTQAVAEMRDLFAEIKKDPRKYLNVKVSIF